MIGAVVILGPPELRLPSVLRPRIPGLPRRERQALARLAATSDVTAGTHVVREGESADAFFVIVRGRATVIRNEHRVAELGPGEFFGEIALLGHGVRSASVVAATDLRLHVIPRRDFAAALEHFPTLGRRVREAALERLAADFDATGSSLVSTH